MTSLLRKRKFYRISGEIFSFISLFPQNRQGFVGFPVNTGVSQGSSFFCQILMIFLMILWNTAIYSDDATPNSKWDITSDLWQQLELASKLEPDPYKHCEIRKEVGNFNSRSKVIASIYYLNNFFAAVRKMNGSILDKESSFKMILLSSSFCKLNWTPYVVPFATTISKKIYACFCSNLRGFFVLSCTLSARYWHAYEVSISNIAVRNE